jgi:hypothetical protein
MAESDDALAECLVYLMQAHIQKYGPIPEAVGTALKEALAALLPGERRVERPPNKPTMPPKPPDIITMVLKRHDGFEMRIPCPYTELPYMWAVPERRRMSSATYSPGALDEYAELRVTQFHRGRRLSETEIEYVEE